jgi:UDP-GlcNAc:undecaprenyl-phosphate GlcNAc-1-phosphate transferase
MELSFFQNLLLFLGSLIAAGLITPLMRKLAFRLDIVDRPIEEHKTHREPIPYLGGIAIILTVLSVVLIGSLFVELSSEVRNTLCIIMVPSLFIGVIGLIDDIKNLSPFSRFVAQSFAGLIAALAITSTDNVGSPTGNVVLDLIISVVWIVGITNAVNFFDNHDGGASGTIAISSFILGILCSVSQQYYIGALAFVLAGASSGFLFWNRNPARIYMGDAGSLFLGMLISTLLLRFDPSPINRWAGFAVPILILAFPILDTSVAVISRIARGISPFTGGQDHLSHRLVRKGNSRRTTAFKLWGGTAFFSLLAVIISFAPLRWEGLLAILGVIAWIFLFVWFFSQNHSSNIPTKN